MIRRRTLRYAQQLSARSLNRAAITRPSPRIYHITRPSSSPSLLPPSSNSRQFSSYPDYEINLTPLQLDDIKSNCNLIDVRQPEELVSEVGAIAGAVNIPLGELAGRMVGRRSSRPKSPKPNQPANTFNTASTILCAWSTSGTCAWIDQG